MSKRRNLQRLLDDAPTVHDGRRGVTAEIAELNRYIRRHRLAWAGNSLIEHHIATELGCQYETSHYSPGGIRRRATYTHKLLTGEPELQHALACQPPDLRNERGLLCTVPQSGHRDEWRYSAAAQKWVRVRRWTKRGDVLTTGRPLRVGRYSARLERAGNREQIRVTRYAGPLTSTRSRTVADSVAIRGTDPHKALRQYVLNHLHPRQKRQHPVTTERLLRRLCPAGWEVVSTPASQGAEPTPAFREIATGEEYHYPQTLTTRSPVAEARQAFARRAQQRAVRELGTLVDRGEAADIYVCARDSYQAGNCPQGTASFARRHGLDLDRHYRAGELAKLANGDTRFVRAAMIAALRRHRVEMSRGYAILAEHKP